MNLGNLPTTKPATDWGGIISQALPAVIAARHQDKVMRENLKREKAGLKPLDVESYKPGVTFGFDKKTLMVIAAIVVAVLVYLFARGRS